MDEITLKTALVTHKITSEEWEFVRSLLRDMQAEDQSEEVATLFGQWKLSIKAFRRVEARRITAITPTENDLLFHKACVTELISLGTLILIASKTHQDASLLKHGISHEIIEATVHDLHNTLDEWHGQVSEQRIATLTDRIFNAPPELNLQNPRALTRVEKAQDPGSRNLQINAGVRSLAGTSL